MKNSLLLWIACLLDVLVLAKPNIYAQQDEAPVEKFALGTGSGGATRFQGRGAASALKQPQSQQQLSNPAAGMLGVINNANNNQWLQQMGNKKPNKPSTSKAAPPVLVATLFTTITEYSLITSSFTTSIVEVYTKTETERETLTRHSTRTIQITTTRISSTTLTTTSTESTTLTEYSLVPFTVTEKETKTETREKLLISTLTLPQITLSETIMKTTTLPVVTKTFTEYLQALTEATVTTYGTVTVTATSVSVLHTAFVTVTTTVDIKEAEVTLEPIIEYLNGENAVSKVEEPEVTETAATFAPVPTFPPLPARQAFQTPAQYTPNKMVNIPFRGYEIDMIKAEEEYMDEGSYIYDDNGDLVYDDNGEPIYDSQDDGYVTGDSDEYYTGDSQVDGQEEEYDEDAGPSSDDAALYTYVSYE
jgi:hypothetical protein